MGKSDRNEARAGRLAQKLKENLKRRKAQARARAGTPASGDRKIDVKTGKLPGDETQR